MPLTKALVDVPITMCCINWILVLEKIEFGLDAVSILTQSAYRWSMDRHQTI